MKKKKILFIILPIILVLVTAAVLVALYFTTDIFRSNNELFGKYFSQNGEAFDIMKNMNTDEQNSFKSTNTYTSTGDLTLTVQDGANTQEIKATTSSRHDMNTGRTYSEMNLKNGEADLLKVSYINSDDIYAIKCDDIMPNYIGVRNSELKKFAQNMGIEATELQNIPDAIDFSAINNMANITDEQKQHIIDTYSKAISESISADKFTKLNKTQISVNGANYETSAYQLAIDGITLKQVVTKCLTTLKDDNATLVMISNKLSNLGLNSEYTDITKLSEMIGKLIMQLQETEASGDSILTITVYENKGRTIRTEIGLTDKRKIIIDKINENNSSKAIITTESKRTSNVTDTTGQTTTTEETDISQITLQKNISEASIINQITIVPDTSNIAESITITKNMGKLTNNTISNTCDIAYSISSDGINVQTVQASYTQNVQATEQVEEIMELKNSNTVIINNYTKEQLTPFLTSVNNKIAEVIPSKLSQLGINASIPQNGQANFNNTITNSKLVPQMIGTAGISIANANGVNTENILTIGMVGSSVYMYNMFSSGIIESAQEATQKIKEQEKIEQQRSENGQKTFDEILGDAENFINTTD